MRIDTDYLVVGAGATGLAFADALVAEADVDVTVIDRQPAAGGHWQNVYDFVRLHSPSAFYGVNSLPLGQDRIDEVGENAGFYERATGKELVDYFAAAAARLTDTGRVRVLTGHEHLGSGGDGEQIRDTASGELLDITVRRKVVDARYQEASVPSTHVRPFQVAADARVIPINDLPAAARADTTYVVLGSGKTAVDACTWLLGQGVTPERIRWIRPRDMYFHDRAQLQPLDQVGNLIDGISIEAQVSAEATSLDELCERLEESGRLWRIDPEYPATMYRGTMLSAPELAGLRQIQDVVRLGRVLRIEPGRIVLERGETPLGREAVVVDCTAVGLNPAPGTPIFQPDRIVLQQVRHNSPPFNAALLAFVETHREDDADKNRLCPPNPHPSSMTDWPRMMRRTWVTEGKWLGEPDIYAWVGQSRLNLLRSLPEHMAEPAVQQSVARFTAHVGAAIQRLKELDGTSQ